VACGAIKIFTKTMAYTKKTLADLKQSLADKHDSGVLPTDSTTLSYWTRLLNEGVQYCAETLRLVKSTSLTTVSGAIALPDDFKRVHKVVVSDSGIEVSQVSQDKSVQQSLEVYWITGNQVDGFTLHTPADQTYTVFYIYRPEDMDSNSDVCVIPDYLAVSCYAYAKLRIAETDPLEDAQESLNECDRRLGEIIDDQQGNDQPLKFSLQLNA